FGDLHEADDPVAPHYRALIRAADGNTVPPVRTAPLPVPLVTLTRALALAFAAGVLLLALRGPRPTPSDDEAVRLATSLGDWQAPTDFLLQTPAAEFLTSAPRLGTGMESVAGDHTDLIETEVTQ
ncbi:MAG TPA: hypothetical protein VKF61_08805, partial [Candidatus Polarisedimenticolia bacterium]|nr:hypothetical protein [Candidatus Polarisedimenticolia bacterium]